MRHSHRVARRKIRLALRNVCLFIGARTLRVSATQNDEHEHSLLQRPVSRRMADQTKSRPATVVASGYQ